GAAARLAAPHAAFTSLGRSQCGASARGRFGRSRPRGPDPRDRRSIEPGGENPLKVLAAHGLFRKPASIFRDPALVFPPILAITPAPLDPGRELNGRLFPFLLNESSRTAWSGVPCSRLPENFPAFPKGHEGLGAGASLTGEAYPCHC